MTLPRGQGQEVGNMIVEEALPILEGAQDLVVELWLEVPMVYMLVSEVEGVPGQVPRESMSEESVVEEPMECHQTLDKRLVQRVGTMENLGALGYRMENSGGVLLEVGDRTENSEGHDHQIEAHLRTQKVFPEDILSSLLKVLVVSCYAIVPVVVLA